jgi:hypothetical protein
MRIPDLFATVERSKAPAGSTSDEAESVHVRTDTVPQDTIAVSPDEAAKAAAAMQEFGNSSGDQLGFKVEYLAD